MILPTMRGKLCKEVNINTWGERWIKNNYRPAPQQSPLLEPGECQKMMLHYYAIHGISWSYGGYGEDRSAIWAGNYLAAGNLYTHLGVDFNAPVGTPVALDRDAKVLHVDCDTPLKGGWGNRVIVQLIHQHIMLIYAHLGDDVMCKVGDRLTPKKVIGRIGPPEQNGYWYPHVHVQAMTYERYNAFRQAPDELDGYCAKEEFPVLTKHFPDPLRWVSAN